MAKVSRVRGTHRVRADLESSAVRRLPTRAACGREWRGERRGRETYATGAALSPSPHPSPTFGSAYRSSFRGRGGPRAAEPRTSHRSASPTDTRSVGSDSVVKVCWRVRRHPPFSPTWSTAPSAVFPCGPRSRGVVKSGSRTGRRGRGIPPAFGGNRVRSCGVTKSRPAIPVGITEISRGSSEANTPGTPPPKRPAPRRGA